MLFVDRHPIEKRLLRGHLRYMYGEAEEAGVPREETSAKCNDKGDGKIEA